MWFYITFTMQNYRVILTGCVNDKKVAIFRTRAQKKGASNGHSYDIII